MKQGHPVELFTYSNLKCSSEITIRNANEILPENRIFTYPNGSPAVFTNYFRYSMLKKLGGWWIDTDVFCIAPLPEDGLISFGKEAPHRYNNATLKFPKDHPALERLISICENPNQFLPWDTFQKKWKKLRRRYLKGNDLGNLKWGETGPSLLTKVVSEFGLEEFGLGQEAFYPVDGEDWEQLFTLPRNELPLTSGNTYSVHLWNEYSKKFDLQTLRPDSFIAEILAG